MLKKCQEDVWQKNHLLDGIGGIGLRRNTQDNINKS
jgi:hypothetical protein